MGIEIDFFVYIYLDSIDDKGNQNVDPIWYYFDSANKKLP